MSNPILAGMFLLVTVSLPGQAPQTSTEASPNEVVESDAALEEAIRGRLAESAIADDDFEVRVSSGVAILEGETDVPQHKGTATRLARRMGAAEVDNRIRVSDAGRRSSSRSRRGQLRRVRVRRPTERSERSAR